MSHAYRILAVAIVAEVVATSALKACRGLTRPGPSALVVVGYGVAFYCLGRSLEAGMPLGIAYAIWSGAGIVLLALAGLALYGERLDAPAIVGTALILAGVVVLNAFSRSVPHG